MMRLTWTTIVLGLVTAMTGCRMCATSCHDYTGPVADCGCQGGCGVSGRSGSILSGAGMIARQPVMTPGVRQQPQQQPQPQPQLQSRYVPSPQRTSNAGLHPEFGVDPRMILSVTDRKVGEEQETGSDASN